MIGTIECAGCGAETIDLGNMCEACGGNPHVSVVDALRLTVQKHGPYRAETPQEELRRLVRDLYASPWPKEPEGK